MILLAALLAFTVHGAQAADLATLTPEERALYDDFAAGVAIPPAELDQATFTLTPLAQEVLPKLEVVRAAVTLDGKPRGEPRLMVRTGGAILFVQDSRKKTGRSGRRFQVDAVVGCPLGVELEVAQLRARLPSHTWKAEQELRKRGCTRLTPTLTEALLTSDVAKDLVPVLLQLAEPNAVVDVGRFSFTRKKDAVTARGTGSAGEAGFRFELHADEDGWKILIERN